MTKLFYVVYSTILLVLLIVVLVGYVENYSYSYNYDLEFILQGLSTILLFICCILGGILHYRVRFRSISFDQLNSKQSDLLIKMLNSQGITLLLAFLLSLFKFAALIGHVPWITPKNTLKLIIFLSTRYMIIICVTYSFTFIPIRYLLTQSNSDMDEQHPQQVLEMKHKPKRKLKKQISLGNLLRDKVGFQLFMAHLGWELSQGVYFLFIDCCVTILIFCVKILNIHAQRYVIIIVLWFLDARDSVSQSLLRPVH